MGRMDRAPGLVAAMAAAAARAAVPPAERSAAWGHRWLFPTAHLAEMMRKAVRAVSAVWAAAPSLRASTVLRDWPAWRREVDFTIRLPAESLLIPHSIITAPKAVMP